MCANAWKTTTVTRVFQCSPTPWPSVMLSVRVLMDPVVSSPDLRSQPSDPRATRDGHESQGCRAPGDDPRAPAAGCPVDEPRSISPREGPGPPRFVAAVGWSWMTVWWEIAGKLWAAIGPDVGTTTDQLAEPDRDVEPVHIRRSRQGCSEQFRRYINHHQSMNHDNHGSTVKIGWFQLVVPLALARMSSRMSFRGDEPSWAVSPWQPRSSPIFGDTQKCSVVIHGPWWDFSVFFLIINRKQQNIYSISWFMMNYDQLHG